jgi:type I restriction enzyme S subunit
MIVRLPALEIQIQIAQALSELDNFVFGANESLPAEIAARRKQYEYYRSKLLTFKELDVA